MPGAVAGNDAGVLMDAGVVAMDAGTPPELDAGTMEAPLDAGMQAEPDAGSGDDGRIDTGKIRPGCGCAGATDFTLAALLLLSLRRSPKSER